MSLTIEQFDFRAYINGRFIEIKDTNNPDRVRVCCPFCSDKRYRLYIYFPAGLVYCQNCGYDPRHFIKFLADMEGMSVEDVSKIFSEFSGYAPLGISVDDIVNSVFTEGGSLEDPVYSTMFFGYDFLRIHEKTGIETVDKQLAFAMSYMHSRGVTDEDLPLYDIRYPLDGQYSGRVIVPCYFNGDLVTFVARDCFNLSKRKYLNPRGNRQSQFLYNLDNCSMGSVVLVEGVFDVFKLYPKVNAVASFGKKLSDEQIKLLGKFDEVIFYWDVDAYKDAEKYSKRLTVSSRTVLHLDPNVDAGARNHIENLALVEKAVPFSSVDFQVFMTNF